MQDKYIFKYKSIFENAILPVGGVRFLLFAVLSYCYFNALIPFYIMHIYMTILMITFLILMYKDSMYYNHVDLPRHAGNFSQKNTFRGKIDNRENGRQMFVITAKGIFEDKEITMIDRFRVFDDYNFLKIGDQVEMSFNPENMKEFCIHPISKVEI